MAAMKCLTLWQPWATFIALGMKTIETRTHDRYSWLVGKRLAIHAGKRWDRTGIPRARAVLRRPEAAAPLPPGMTWENLERVARAQAGHVICTAKVMAHKRCRAHDAFAALCDCEGDYGLVLDELRTLDHAVPAKGHRGVWGFVTAG